MKECILGISSFGHDTSACLVNALNGEIIFASAQERYSNIKYDDSIPLYTINECLKIAEKLNFKIIKATISCNYKLFLGNYLFSRIEEIVEDKKLSTEILSLLKNNLESSEYYNKFSLTKNFLDNFFSNNEKKLSNKKINNLKNIITWYFNWSIKHMKIENLLQKFIGKIELVRINHHLSHAASAYFSSGFDEANIIVMDGQGEEETITIYNASNRNLNLISRSIWPNSLGIFYLEGTKVLGYSLGDEYKVMGMSAYGKPTYQKALEKSFNINKNGELTINETDYLGFCEIKDTGHRSIYFKEKIKKNFKIIKNNNFEQNHFDFASSLQNTVENIGVNLSEWAFEKTKKIKSVYQAELL